MCHVHGLSPPALRSNPPYHVISPSLSSLAHKLLRSTALFLFISSRIIAIVFVFLSGGSTMSLFYHKRAGNAVLNGRNCQLGLSIS